MTMIALANLSKYLGIYEHWRSIVKNAGLKWEKKNALDTLINILNTDITKVEEWLKSIIPKLSTKYSIQPVKASGTIYIRANGSVDPPTAPIQRNGSIYTFVDEKL